MQLPLLSGKQCGQVVNLPAGTKAQLEPSAFAQSAAPGGQEHAAFRRYEIMTHTVTAAWCAVVPEEASAVFAGLGILENMVEVKPEVAELVTDKTKVGGWVGGRGSGPARA